MYKQLLNSYYYNYYGKYFYLKKYFITNFDTINVKKNIIFAVIQKTVLFFLIINCILLNKINVTFIWAATNPVYFADCWACTPYILGLHPLSTQHNNKNHLALHIVQIY